MKAVNKIYKYLLVAAVVVYVVGSCIIEADQYSRIGKLEHAATHAKH